MRKEKILAYVLENALGYGKARADVVLGHLFREGLEKKDIKKVLPEIKKAVDEVNNLSREEIEEKFSKLSGLIKEKKAEKRGLRELPNAKKGKVILRLAPFPSGALHIGNAKTYLLNALYAEKYKGKLLLVIDDTVGSEVKGIVKEAYKLIPDAFDWLKVKYKKPIIYKSDRLEIYYKYAEELIKKGRAYVCSCSQEVLRENRRKERECSCRQFGVDEQMSRWKEMFKAKSGDFVLRIKTSMQHPNPAFRDRVLFRVSELNHPRVGRRYKVWPLLEFSWAIDDHLLGITHIIRGKDLMIETEMEKYVWDIFKWKHPEIIHSGLIKIEGLEAKISKSKAQREVKSGVFAGWDDPRTWSVQSLRRRGFAPESLRKFVEGIGLTEKDIVVPIESLYAENRKILDKEADRYSFVLEPVKLKIKKMPKIKELKVKIHPEKSKTRKIKLGKEIFISKKDFEKFRGKEVRLMHLFNLKLGRNSEVTSIENTGIDKINWVSNFVKARILMEDGVWVGGLAEEDVKKLKPGKIIQFERFGFCRFDRKLGDNYEFWFAHR